MKYLHSRNIGRPRSIFIIGSRILLVYLCLQPFQPSVYGEGLKVSQPAEKVVSTIPDNIEGQYAGGELLELRVRKRMAYVVRPKAAVDVQRRWIWICPFWLAINNGHGVLEHRFYVERMLAAGFHVAGVNVGTSCGSPAAAEVCHEFYELVTEQYQLSRKTRIVGQSNGGLIAYAWAFRHPECVERIAGICPATDFRTWPGLYNTIQFPDKDLPYGFTLNELEKRITEFNPVENLAPLASAGVKIMHIHGDQDDVVPMAENSTVLADRYRQLGGEADIVVLKGLAHGGIPLYESVPFIEFVTAK